MPWTAPCTASYILQDAHSHSVQVTGKHFEMGENFNLGDLLKLELHNAVEECREIVDRAQKELVIEKSLRKIEDTWAGLKLSFAPYQVCRLASHRRLLRLSLAATDAQSLFYV